MSSTIEIQLYDCRTGTFENCPVGKNGVEEVVIGGSFRILVDGEPIYENGEAKS